MTDFTTQQPSVFTLGEAAKAVGISKPTLSRAISTGRLSCEKRPDGSYRIQAAELFRVYPPGHKGNGLPGVGIADLETGNDNRLLDGEINRLQQQLAAVTQERERLAEERERERRQLQDRIDNLERRLDLEGEERRKLTAILTDQRVKPVEVTTAPPPQPAPAPAVTQAGFWGRLFGKG